MLLPSANKSRIGNFSYRNRLRSYNQFSIFRSPSLGTRSAYKAPSVIQGGSEIIHSFRKISVQLTSVSFQSFLVHHVRNLPTLFKDYRLLVLPLYIQFTKSLLWNIDTPDNMRKKNSQENNRPLFCIYSGPDRNRQESDSYTVMPNLYPVPHRIIT